MVIPERYKLIYAFVMWLERRRLTALVNRLHKAYMLVSNEQTKMMISREISQALRQRDEITPKKPKLEKWSPERGCELITTGPLGEMFASFWR